MKKSVILACLCHSDLFGILLQKDAGQASMTKRKGFLTSLPTGQAGGNDNGCGDMAIY
jgi:hypothetical protein